MLSQSQSNALIIASMHRSGSSLTAAILQSAGVYIGRELLSPNVGNIKGHYENLDFYHFHMAVLESQGINSSGWTLQEKIDVEDRFVEKAKEIIKKNSLSEIWGWKEPRTTLFLDFWAELLPEAKFIFVYRYPWEVIDSLYRRGDPIFQSQPDMAIKIWLHYNQKILNCYNRFSDRSHLASLNNIISTSDKYIESVNQRLQINLIYSGANIIYEPPLLQQLSLDSYRPSLVAHYFPEAIKMYQELEARAWQPQGDPDFSWLEKINANPYRIWAFQDWASVRSLERQNQVSQNNVDPAQLVNLQAQFQQVQTELQQTRLVLDELISQRDETLAIVDLYQSQLHQTEEVLQQSQAQLEASRSNLQSSQNELQEVRSNFQTFQDELKKLDTEAKLIGELHQAEKLLSEYETHLEELEVIGWQSQTELQSLKDNFQTKVNTEAKLIGELHQAEKLLSEYETHLEELEVIGWQSQTELQSLKDNFQTKVNTEAKLIGELHQAEELLSEYETHLEELEAITSKYQDQYLESKTQLQQTQADANEYQYKYHKSEDALHKYKTELEQRKAQFHTRMSEAEALIEDFQQQLIQTESVLTDYRGCYEENQLDLQEVRSHLHQNQTELKRYQSENYQLIEELSMLDQQTKQKGEIITEQQKIITEQQKIITEKQEIITEKQEIIMQLEAVKNNIQQEAEQLELLSQEYQSHIDELQQAIEDLFSIKQDEANTYKQEINKMRQNQVESEIVLANYKSQLKATQVQLKATQVEIEQLKAWQIFNDSQVSEGGLSKYKTLVWQGWQAYNIGNYGQMVNYLQQSLAYAPLSRPQAIIDWVENFSRFSSAQATSLDTYSLTNLPEWQKLVRQTARSSPPR
ncbi:hypothetical protein [Microcoleus sp. F4-D5]|uniref:hypothetical protein n=1 Tax=Microcoleus sp. F4-D5 TaxID=2818760 RepID=UPI002FCEB878